MAGQAYGPKIDELTKVAASLDERLANVRKEVAEVHKELDELSKKNNDLDKAVAVIAERLNEFKRTAEEAGRRSAAFLPPLVAGICGAIMALLGQLLVRKIFG